LIFQVGFEPLTWSTASRWPSSPSMSEPRGIRLQPANPELATQSVSRSTGGDGMNWTKSSHD